MTRKIRSWIYSLSFVGVVAAGVVTASGAAGDSAHGSLALTFLWIAVILLAAKLGGLVEKLVGNKVNEKPSVVVEKKEPVTENIEDNVEDKKENYTKKLRALTGSATLSSNHIYRSNSYYYIWRRWGFGITDGSLTPEGSRYGRWRFKNRSWDLTYDLDYLIINHIELTIGIGYISEGEASLGNTDIITNEVSGYRLISLFRKSFGNWGLILGYHQNKYEYKLF